MGITFAILRACGNSPAEKEQFIISASGVAIDTLPIYILNQNYNFSQPCVFIIKENEIRTIITSILIPSVPVFKGFITDLFVTSSDLLISRLPYFALGLYLKRRIFAILASYEARIVEN